MTKWSVGLNIFLSDISKNYSLNDLSIICNIDIFVHGSYCKVEKVHPSKGLGPNKANRWPLFNSSYINLPVTVKIISD